MISCSQPLKRWRTPVGLGFALLGLTAVHPAQAQVAVLTQNNDNSRTGTNSAEATLKPANVKAGNFGKLFTLPLDANVNGQPLYVPGVTIKGAVHNVIYAYTSNNRDGSNCGLWAYDADAQAAALWHTTFNVSAQYTTATPVIDPATQTIYVLTKNTNNEGANFLHAIDITTGRERGNSPIQIQASAPGAGAGSVNNTVYFDGNHGNGFFHANERPGLLLSNGVIYLGFAFNSDAPPYHGWVLGYTFDGTNFTQRYVFCTTPNGGDGGIWQSGKGMTVDASGNIYCSVGNGTFDANTGGSDYGMCYLKLSPSLKVLDYFAPYDEQAQSNNDADIANSGPAGIPGTSRLFAGATKFGTGFLYNAANLGQYVGPNKPAKPGVDGVGGVVQRLDGISGGDNVGQNPVAFDTGTFKYVYLWPDSQGLEQFQYDPKAGPVDKNGQTGQLNPAGIFKQSATLSGGGSLGVSSNGSSNAILWSVGRHDSSSATLYAFDATDVTKAPLYSDATLSSGHFQFPTVANGKVYMPTGSASIAVYGLLTPTTPLLPLFRSYDAANIDHLYTTNGAEQAAAAQSSYALEGVIGYTPAAAAGTAPIYRLYNPANADHFYTASQAEAQAAQGGGYSLEGTAFQVYAASATGTLPLYRLYSPVYGHHFYTTSQAEHDGLVASGAWNDEGIIGYLSTGL